jgi:putative transposase
MTNIRRYDAINRPVFMTAVCSKRHPHLAGDENKQLLLSVIREIKHEKPFAMLGYVILDDHFHWMIQLPRGGMSGNPQKTGNTLTYNNMGKTHLSGRYASHPALTYDSTTNIDGRRSGCDHRELPDKRIPHNAGPASKYTISEIMQSVKLQFTHRYKKSHGINGNVSIWQRRFWDHIARDQGDINRHLDYIHYNPVKHGHAAKPLDYRFSSFSKYVELEIYPPDWGATEEPVNLSDVTWE